MADSFVGCGLLYQARGERRGFGAMVRYSQCEIRAYNGVQVVHSRGGIVEVSWSDIFWYVHMWSWLGFVGNTMGQMSYLSHATDLRNRVKSHSYLYSPDSDVFMTGL